jgi:hypothetical protein
LRRLAGQSPIRPAQCLRRRAIHQADAQRSGPIGGGEIAAFGERDAHRRQHARRGGLDGNPQHVAIGIAPAGVGCKCCLPVCFRQRSPAADRACRADRYLRAHTVTPFVIDRTLRAVIESRR